LSVVVAPLQITEFVTFVVIEKDEGCVTMNVFVVIVEVASVTLQVYVPAGRLEALDVVPPIGDQEYVKGPVPPETDAVRAAVDKPLQVIVDVCEIFTKKVESEVIKTRPSPKFEPEKLACEVPPLKDPPPPPSG
jgi:hypothetical protein